MKFKVKHLEMVTQDKREFDISDLFKSIYKTVKFCSWGVSQQVNYFNKALALKVNGHHFTGVVFITLAGNDTFSIYFFKTMKIEAETHGVYIDNLLNVIDQKVEYIKEYGNN